MKPLICLTLTAQTLKEDADLVKKYTPYIDIAELRVDYLTEDEQLIARTFPSMVEIPCILTIRRDIDGGKFSGNEFSRTALFARALSFADQNPNKNFAYVDFEDYFHVPSLQDAALAFGVKIIRSIHDFKKPVRNLNITYEKMCSTRFEIPKVAFMPEKLSDITQAYKESNEIERPHILAIMGPMGACSRILASKFNSCITYTSPIETAENTKSVGHLDPVTINDLYRFRQIDVDTKICAVTGWPLKATSSPLLHNIGYKKYGMNRVFIPLPSTSFEDSFEFANTLKLDGLSVTVPYKEASMDFITGLDADAFDIGACNTIVRAGENDWIGHNTDAGGFQQALSEFLGVRKLKKRKVAIIGAGGAAHAVAYAIKQMGGKACIFNRTVQRARSIAERYGFEYSPLDEEHTAVLEKYSDIIIQTTNVGMNSNGISTKETNPIYFYSFRGTEYLYDIVYDPEITPIMSAALAAGCKVSNGFSMLKYQAYIQFKYYTGMDYE